MTKPRGGPKYPPRPSQDIPKMVPAWTKVVRSWTQVAPEKAIWLHKCSGRAMWTFQQGTVPFLVPQTRTLATTHIIMCTKPTPRRHYAPDPSRPTCFLSPKHIFYFPHTHSDPQTHLLAVGNKKCQQERQHLIPKHTFLPLKVKRDSRHHT